MSQQREFGELTWKQALVILASGLVLITSACFGLLSRDDVGMLTLGLGLGLAGTGMVGLFDRKVWPGRDDILACFLLCVLWAGAACMAASAWVPSADLARAGVQLLGLLLVAAVVFARFLSWLWRTRS